MHVPWLVMLADPAHAPAQARRVLASVPEWFAIESANEHYIASTARYPTWIASDPATHEAVAFLTVMQHYAHAAEVWCMAVHRQWHRRGVGSALLSVVERQLASAGTRFLQVKTKGPSLPCREYEQTLRFYQSQGFHELEELRGIWPGIPALLLVKTLAF